MMAAVVAPVLLPVAPQRQMAAELSPITVAEPARSALVREAAVAEWELQQLEGDQATAVLGLTSVPRISEAEKQQFMPRPPMRQLSPPLLPSEVELQQSTRAMEEPVVESRPSVVETATPQEVATPQDSPQTLETALASQVEVPRSLDTHPEWFPRVTAFASRPQVFPPDKVLAFPREAFPQAIAFEFPRETSQWDKVSVYPPEASQWEVSPLLHELDFLQELDQWAYTPESEELEYPSGWAQELDIVLALLAHLEAQEYQPVTVQEAELVATAQGQLHPSVQLDLAQEDITDSYLSKCLEENKIC